MSPGEPAKIGALLPSTRNEAVGGSQTARRGRIVAGSTRVPSSVVARWRMAGRAVTPRAPGHSVACVWRCGKMRGTVSVVPGRYLEVEPPPVSVTVPRGSTAGPSANFQAAYCAVASIAAGGTGVAVKLPITAIPAVPVL